MANLSINDCYKILNTKPSASNDDINKAFKVMAMKYHPDKNRSNVEWANNEMSKINQAYSTIMSIRFQQTTESFQNDIKNQSQTDSANKTEKSYHEEQVIRENLIKQFAKIKESTNESIYRYFQYSLFNFKMRDKVLNKSIFNEIVNKIKKSYHSIQHLCTMTEDPELLEHFKIFSEMIFSFYKASECLNILDSYENSMDVEAYRIYNNADEILHNAHKEVFYERHNRGYFEESKALPGILKAQQYFLEVIKLYPQSSWVVETKIKLEYCKILISYINLFFSEE